MAVMMMMERAGSPRRLVWRHASQHLLNASADWTTASSSTPHNNTASLQFSYRVVCTGNYHGPRCATFCRPRDDINGHYRCTQNGTMVCLDGWTGAYCQRREYPLPDTVRRPCSLTGGLRAETSLPFPFHSLPLIYSSLLLPYPCLPLLLIQLGSPWRRRIGNTPGDNRCSNPTSQ